MDKIYKKIEIKNYLGCKESYFSIWKIVPVFYYEKKEKKWCIQISIVVCERGRGLQTFLQEMFTNVYEIFVFVSHWNGIVIDVV